MWQCDNEDNSGFMGAINVAAGVSMTTHAVGNHRQIMLRVLAIINILQNGVL
jgi:hypothetical protein